LQSPTEKLNPKPALIILGAALATVFLIGLIIVIAQPSSKKGGGDNTRTVDKLMGRTKRQVIDMLGEPAARTSSYFQYTDPVIYSPNLKKVVVLRLAFGDEGRVNHVEYMEEND
jgi:hypothetical protein